MPKRIDHLVFPAVSFFQELPRRIPFFPFIELHSGQAHPGLSGMGLYPDVGPHKVRDGCNRH